MALDPRIQSAVRSAVEDAGQDKSLAAKIISWMEKIADGSESLDDAEAVHRRLELLYEFTKVDELSCDED